MARKTATLVILDLKRTSLSNKINNRRQGLTIGGLNHTITIVEVLISSAAIDLGDD